MDIIIPKTRNFHQKVPYPYSEVTCNFILKVKSLVISYGYNHPKNEKFSTEGAQPLFRSRF